MHAMWISFRLLEEDIVAQFLQKHHAIHIVICHCFQKGSKKESYIIHKMNAILEESILSEAIKSGHCHFLGMKTRLLLVN